jgi:hypothetical protein
VSRRGRRAAGSLLACALAVALGAAPAGAGSTEPELALAEVAATVEDGVVTLEVLGNFDHGNFVRLGYPLELVVAAGGAVARLGLDGGVLVAAGGEPAVPLPDAPGVVAIGRERLSAVLPPVLEPAGTATVRLEADFDGTRLRSNAVTVRW